MPTTPAVLPRRTERLLLRDVRPDDVDALHAYYGDPDVARYLPFGVLDRAAVQERVGRWREAGQPAVGGAGGEVLHAMVEVPGRGLVGDVILRFTDGDPVSVGEVGWAFHPDVAGLGYATEAARAVVDLAFDHFGFHRVTAQLDPRNGASSRLCARLGMTREAHLRRSWQELDGSWTDNEIWGLLREEWRTPRPEDPADTLDPRGQ